MPFSKFVNFIVLMPQVVSTFLYSLVYIQFVENALPTVMNKLFGVINFPNIIWNNATAYGNNLFFSIWLSFGTSVLVYSNAIRSIDNEIFESARLDGVNDVQEFFSIILPLIWPTLTTMVVTSVTSIFTWSGSLMVFYMYDAPPHIWGLGYFFTRTVKVSMANGTEYLSYPTVATSGLLDVQIISSTKFNLITSKFTLSPTFVVRAPVSVMLGINFSFTVTVISLSGHVASVSLTNFTSTLVVPTFKAEIIFPSNFKILSSSDLYSNLSFSFPYK